MDNCEHVFDENDQCFECDYKKSIKHNVKQPRPGYSNHVCGNSDIQSGKNSAYDLADVTCKQCLALLSE